MNDIFNRWDDYIEHVAELIRKGASTKGLGELFAGTSVKWTGIVRTLDLDEFAPGVEFDMPRHVLDLGHGKSDTIDGIAMPIAEDDLTNWRAIRAGDHVQFEATLGSGNVVFPAVEVITLDPGRTILMIRLHDGRLIRRLNSR